MVRIGNVDDLKLLQDDVVKKRMEARLAMYCIGDEELWADVEGDLDCVLGGDWYVFEEGDDPEAFPIEGCPINLLSDDWDWCDYADFEHGCFFYFVDHQ